MLLVSNQQLADIYWNHAYDVMQYGMFNFDVSDILIYSDYLATPFPPCSVEVQGRVRPVKARSGQSLWGQQAPPPYLPALGVQERDVRVHSFKQVLGYVVGSPSSSTSPCLIHKMPFGRLFSIGEGFTAIDKHF